MERVFKFTLRVKDCEQEFKEGMGKGVLLTQEVVYKTAPAEETPMFVRTVSDQARQILHDSIVVDIEEIE